MTQEPKTANNTSKEPKEKNGSNLASSEPFTRVTLTSAAHDIIEALKQDHGPLLFHQSGGCCDGSAPMCYTRDEFKMGEHDVFLGWIAETPFYMSGAQFNYWQHTHLTVDVVSGRGSGFSLEAPLGVRFLLRSRLFTPEEEAHRQALGPPPTGSHHST